MSLGKRWKRSAYFLFTVPAVLLYLIFFAFPVVSGLFYSLTDWNGISPTFQFVGLQNYLSVFQDKLTMSAVGRTFWYTLVMTFLVTALSVLLAVLLNQKLKLQGFWRVTYFFPAVMSSITIGLIFNQIYYHVVPLVGKSLGIALLSKNPLSNRNLAMWAIMLIQIWKETAVPTVLILAALQSISADLYEAATIDGATGMQSFWNITLPLVKPTIGVAALMSIRSGLMMFDYVKATTNGGPANATTTIAVSIFKHAFTDMKFAYSSAESILVFIVIMLIALVQIKMVQERD
ncbi:MAG: sugar ABC transporter permease [Candidatus Limiplasma sp.]|mgnify:FL=1|nr:sugar ABC transporter permease [Clostridiales bacterium]MDY4063665.1 sugar ABC transporter permease [Candidatus Limiplasma sp.]